MEDPLFLNLGHWKRLASFSCLPRSPVAESPTAGGVCTHETRGRKTAGDTQVGHCQTPECLGDGQYLFASMYFVWRDTSKVSCFPKMSFLPPSRMMLRLCLARSNCI